MSDTKHTPAAPTYWAATPISRAMTFKRPKQTDTCADLLVDQKHTPGPWGIVCDGGGEPEAVFNQPKNIHAANGCIATMAGRCGGPAEWLANARLIAAAPDLLTALKDLVAWPALVCCADSRVAQARAAIAKVKQEPT